MVPNIIGKHTDGVWAINTHLQHGCAHHFDFFEKKIPNGGMVLRLGYSGLHQSIGSLFDRGKNIVF